MHGLEGGNMDELSLGERVEQFVLANRVPGHTRMRVCGDGRVDGSKEEVGALALFGADQNLLGPLVQWGLTTGNLTPEQSAELLVRTIIKQGAYGHVFNLHTDTHADPFTPETFEHADDHAIGCKHALLAVQKDPGMREAMLKIAQMKAQGMPIRVQTLQGGHQEQAILLVDGKDSVRHTDPKTGEQMFVVDLERKDKYTDTIVDALRKELRGKRLVGLDAIAANQMDRTRMAIAATLKVYHVNLKDRKPVVDLF